PTQSSTLSLHDALPIFKSHDIAEHLKIVENVCLSFIRLVKRHIIVGSCTDVIDILHVVIHALDHMMTGRTECDKILPLLFCVVERADGGKLCCDLVGSQRINPAAALPLADLFQFKSQSFCGNSGIVVKILCLVLQSTARKIAVFHSITSLSVRRKQRTALCCLMIPCRDCQGFVLDIQLSDYFFQFVCAGLKFCNFLVC